MMTFRCECGTAYARIDHLLDHRTYAHKEFQFARPVEEEAAPCTACGTTKGARQRGYRRLFRDSRGRCAACNLAGAIAA